MKTKEFTKQPSTEELTDEQLLAEIEEFRAKYPDCPEEKPIPVLDMLSKRENAEAILRGEKTVEYREWIPVNAKDVLDQKICDFLDRHIDDEEVMSALDNYFSEIRIVDTIHFHSYNNSWYLDVEVIDNGWIAITPEEVKYMQETYNCRDIAKLHKKVKQAKLVEPPVFFYFAIGKVIKTNLN